MSPPAVSRLRRWVPPALAVLCMLVAAAPLLLAIFRTLSAPYFPAGDQAVIELRVRDVGGLHTPLLGPYSRYYWNHPGPMIYALLAVPYRLLGSQSTGLLAASGIINLASIAGLGAIAWRRGRLPLVALTAIGLGVLIQNLGVTYLQNPWNPYLTLLPVALFVFLAWTTVEGDRWAAPITVFVGSFLIESHIGYALIVGAVGAWCAALVIRGRRRAVDTDPSWRRPVIACGVVFAICWLPVVIDQFFGTHNFGSIVEYFATGDRTPVGFDKAGRFLSRELGGGPPRFGIDAPWLGSSAPWIGGEELVDPGSGSVVTQDVRELVPPALWFAVATALAWVTKARSALRLQAAVAVALFAAYVSLARITDTVYDYLIKWTWVLAMVLWISIFWTLFSAFMASSVPDRLRAIKLFDAAGRPGFALRVAGVGLALYALCQLAVVTEREQVPLPEGWAQPTMAALSDRVATMAPSGGLVRVRGEGGFVNSVTDGVALQLERHGHAVEVEPYDDYKFGAHRTTDVGTTVATVWVVYADAIDRFETRSDLQEVGRWDPLSPSERDQYRRDNLVLHDEFTALQRKDLLASLATGDSLYLARDREGVDQKLLDRYEKARDRGTPVAIFLGPATGA